MGVAGSGKTTIGKQLAERLGWPFFDADDFHPAANVAKMSRGVPLNDEDRAGWLAALADLLRRRAAEGGSAVLACSALKQRYRDRLRIETAPVRFVYLKGSLALLQERLAARRDHFMKADMLTSQFATLEEPRDALAVDVADPPDRIVDFIQQSLCQP